MPPRPTATRRVACLLAMVATAATLVPAVLVPAAAAVVPDKPLPVKTWRKAANDICRQSGILRSDIADEVFVDLPADAQPSIELMTAYVEQIEPVVQQQIDSIDALQEPKNLRKKVGRMLATAQDELDALVEDPSIGLEANPFSATELAAKKLKLKQCS
ncbi:MAG TPA: hypothetical protein VFW06_03915 [Acidimicrobiia bacterium]|nr:hypothetical protein [Acidimicrobiia bacterium]